MKKTSIVVYWKKEDKYEVYSSLVGFVKRNPQYNIHTLYHWITRKGVPYQDNNVMVLRAPYLTRL